MNLFKFELKKFLFNWKTLVLIIVFSVLLIGGSLRHELDYRGDKVWRQSLISTVKFNLANDTNPIGSAAVLSKEEQKERDAYIKIREDELTALEHDDINKYYEARYKEIMKFLEKGEDKNLRDEANYIELVKKRGLDFEYNPDIQSHAFGKLVTTLNTIFSELWLLGFAMILTVSFASIFENKEIRIYHALGTKNFSLIGKKILSSIGGTYLWLLLLSGVYFLMIGFLNGFGSPNYPAHFQETPSPSDIFSGNGKLAEIHVVNPEISNGEVIVISLIYALFVLFFLAALGLFFSALTKKSFLMIAFVAILVEGYSYIQYDTWLQDFRKFIPMSYLNPVELLKYPDVLFGKNSLYVGFGYLLVLGIVFLLASHLILKKYQLRRI